MEKSRIFTEIEVEELYWLCSAAEEHEAESWIPVREWFESKRKNEKLLVAAITNQEDGETPLHVILRKHPPLDIVREMIEISPNILRVKNSNEMIPLHIACKHSASVEVVDKLIQVAPNTVNYIDRFSWLPIHFACANPESSVDVVMRLLRDANETVRSKNDKDQLPIHLACASCASLEFITRLLKDDPDTVHEVDYLNRTPLLTARCYAAPLEVVRLLQEIAIETNAKKIFEAKSAEKELDIIISNYDRREKERAWKVINEWIDKYRSNDFVSVPMGFYDILWELPCVLRDLAVRDEFVQMKLNKQFSNRYSIIYVMLDIYCSLLMIPMFYLASKRQITIMFSTNSEPFLDSNQNKAYIILLAFCGAFQLYRGMTRLIHHLAHKAFLSILLSSPITNCLHLANSLVIFFWIGAILSPTYFTSRSSIYEKEAFRCVAAIWIIFLCLEAWNVLTTASFTFAVTSNAVQVVLLRMTYFLYVVIFLIVAFSLMFSVIYTSTNICEDPGNFPFCNLGTSIVELYLFLYGSVDYTYYLSANGVELEPQQPGNFAIGL